MSKENLVFIITAEQGYIRNIDDSNDFTAQNEILFSAVSDTYLPLLNMLSRLETEGVSFKIGVVLSAPLCTLLDDPQVQKQYIDFLERKIAFSSEEVKRLKNQEQLHALALQCLEKAQKDKFDFTEVYEQKLLEKFKYFAQKGFIELIPTAATHAFLPHYADMTEVLNAQVETGLLAHRHFFGETGEGFYLPYLGWAEGIDKVLRSYSINYSVVDAKSFMFSTSTPQTGIFSPVRTNNSLALFANDPDTYDELCGSEAYSHNKVYRSQQRDVGFDLENKAITEFIGKGAVRVQTGCKYYSNSSESENNVIYNPEEAVEQAKKDALAFVTAKTQKLKSAASLMSKQDVTLVCTIPSECLGQSWYEGIIWFEEVLRLVEKSEEVNTELTQNLIANQFTLQKIVPYPSAANGTGYGEDLLDGTNSWMMRYIRKASERMIDLTERFPSDTGLKARLLNLGAKEILLAQSGDWAKMLHDQQLPEYVTASFIKNINSFTSVFDSLGSNTVSTEWLTEMEKQDAIFPWMNYKIFSKKK